MKALGIAIMIMNFIAGTIGYAILLSLLLGFGNAKIASPWGDWAVNARSATTHSNTKRER